jgi:hypothetical protein
MSIPLRFSEAAGDKAMFLLDFTLREFALLFNSAMDAVTS